MGLDELLDGFGIDVVKEIIASLLCSGFIAGAAVFLARWISAIRNKDVQKLSAREQELLRFKGSPNEKMVLAYIFTGLISVTYLWIAMRLAGWYMLSLAHTLVLVIGHVALSSILIGMNIKRELLGQALFTNLATRSTAMNTLENIHDHVGWLLSQRNGESLRRDQHIHCEILLRSDWADWDTYSKWDSKGNTPSARQMPSEHVFYEQANETIKEKSTTIRFYGWSSRRCGFLGLKARSSFGSWVITVPFVVADSSTEGMLVVAGNFEFPPAMADELGLVLTAYSRVLGGLLYYDRNVWP